MFWALTYFRPLFFVVSPSFCYDSYMSQWSTKRQFSYLSGVFLFLLITIGTPVYFYFFNNPPTCSDRKQNGDEAGIDCGGVCARFCTQDTLPPIVLWQRMSRVSDGFHNALAFVENPNHDATLVNASYSFKLFDKTNVLIAERRGRVSLPPKIVVPIFEGTITTGSDVPARITFEVAGTNWQKEAMEVPLVVVSNTVYSNEDGFPRVSGILTNKSLKTIEPLYAVAVVYDNEGNAMAFSRTLLDPLLKNASAEAVFTWREDFPTSYSKIEILPQVLIGH